MSRFPCTRFDCCLPRFALPGRSSIHRQYLLLLLSTEPNDIRLYPLRRELREESRQGAYPLPALYLRQ